MVNNNNNCCCCFSAGSVHTEQQDTVGCCCCYLSGGTPIYTCEGDRLADRAPGYVRHANALRIICLGDRATRIKNHQIY